MHVPAWATRRVFHPLWALKDGSHVRRLLRESERNQYLDQPALAELQWRRLKGLLHHAEQHVPHYRELFRERGLSAKALRDWSDIERLPILRKSTIQKAEGRLRAERLPDPADMYVENRTGGSTGSPLRFFTSRRRAELREATTIRHNRWTGWELGEPMAVLWGAARDLRLGGIKRRLRHALLEKTLTLNTASLDARQMHLFAAKLQKERPRTWLAYANSSLVFVRFLREHRITGLEPEAVITSAETLTPENRALIETTLGCRVYDRYGCREVSVIASECGRHPDHALHIAADVLRVEVIGRGGEGTARTGKIIITDLMNFAMPFIRYQIEDVSNPARGVCRCGRTLPLLAPVTGRTSDFLVTADGRVVSGTALTVLLLAELPGIAQGQLLQHERGRVVFRLVPRGQLSKQTKRAVLDACRGALGRDTEVEIDVVDEIPQAASGKFPFAISEVDPFEVLG